MKLDDLLAKLDACTQAREWAEGKTLAEAWETCNRADWMMWLAGWLGVDRKTLVRAASACARTALHLIPAGDGRPRRAVETAEAWTRGEATIEQVRKAAYDAYAVTYCAADAAAYDYDANAAYYTAAAALRGAGETADLPALVRAHITVAMIEEAANAA